MMAKYSNSYKSKPCKPGTSEPCTAVRNSAPGSGMQVYVGDQVCPFCGRGISRGVNFSFLEFIDIYRINTEDDGISTVKDES